MVRFGVLVVSLFLLGLANPAAAASKPLQKTAALSVLPLRSTFESVGPQTTTPYGWADFCRRYAGECNEPPLAAADVELTADKWKQIEQINRTVNDAIDPTSDMDHWGLVDQWDYPMDAKGDCEDYALLKRKMLISAGFPRQAILMTVVHDLQGEGHAILTVKTDRGDFILDNMTSEIVPWSTTGYRYVKRQSQEDPNVWLTLRGADAPVVGATP
jgi:predicted transglutaminase-like cysteine proteinase